MNKLLHQLFGWLVLDDLAGEDAGCGGSELVWFNIVVRMVGCTAESSETTFSSQARALVEVLASAYQ